MAHHVFISYASKNKQLADALCHTLEQHRISCWIAPRDVLPGEPYAREIIRGIRDCAILSCKGVVTKVFMIAHLEGSEITPFSIMRDMR